MNRLKQLRLEKGLKQIELSKKLNISQGALSGWETGRYDIGNSDLVRLADYFGVTTDYLLGRESATSAEFTIIDTLSDGNAQNTDITLSEAEIEILLKLRTLNEKGNKKVVTYLDDLLENPSNIRNDDTVKNEGVS